MRLQRILKTIGLLSVLMAPAGLMGVDIYFANAYLYVSENDDVSITLVMSEGASVDVTVDLVLDSGGTTATAMADADATTGDYFIDEDATDTDEDGFSWDASAGRGSITITPGNTSKTVTFSLNNDNDEEGLETMRFRLEQGEVEVSRIVNPFVLDILIYDEDPVEISFDNEVLDIVEGVNANARFSLSATIPIDIAVAYSLSYGTAADSDIDRNAGITASPLTIPAGTGSGVFVIPILADLIVEEDETFTIDMGEVSYPNADGPVPITFGNTAVTVSIIDDDPLMVELENFGIDEDDENGLFYDEREEGQSIELTIAIKQDGSEDDARGRLSEDLEVPVVFSGSAERRESTDDEVFDYSTSIADEGGTVTIPAGNASATLTITMRDDATVEEMENIIITLGQPVLAESETNIPLGSNITYSLAIEDNDPQTFSFVKLNPDFDPEDEESEQYIPADSMVVSESDGTVGVPILLSSRAAGPVSFDIEIVSSGTSATLFDNEVAADEQEWDFFISVPSVTALDEAVTATLPAGATLATLQINLNNDDEPAIVYGQAPPEGVEDDETITIRISNLDAEDANVSFGEVTEFTVTIKEFADIDLTHLMSGLAPRQDNWVNGRPPRNPLSGLHELQYALQLQQALDPQEFVGYRTLKYVFRQNRFNVDDRDDPQNDVLNPSINQSQIDGFTPFFYEVINPFNLRYPSGTETEVLVEGTERINDVVFTEENADVIVNDRYILQPVNLPVLDPEVEDSREEHPDIGSLFDYLIEFGNSGVTAFDVSRIDPVQNPDALRVYLSRQDVREPGGFTGSYNVAQFEVLDDGTVMMEIINSGLGALGIEYMDEFGGWRVAEPYTITRVGSRLLWFDYGPPKTDRHPSETQMRLYRVFSR